jgi:hypothetical protein
LGKAILRGKRGALNHIIKKGQMIRSFYYKKQRKRKERQRCHKERQGR